MHPVEHTDSSPGLHKGVEEGQLLPLVKDGGDAGVLVIQHDEVPGDAGGKVAQLGLDRKLGEKRIPSPFSGESLDIQIILQSGIPSA